MICLKVPEVGARLAGGACAAASVESASTIATNIASLVFIAVPRSGQPGELRQEVVLVEPVRTRFRVDLRVGLRPGARPVAGKAAARNLVAATLVHRTLHGALEATV